MSDRISEDLDPVTPPIPPPSKRRTVRRREDVLADAERSRRDEEAEYARAEAERPRELPSARDGIGRKRYRTYRFAIPQASRKSETDDPRVVVLRELDYELSNLARSRGDGEKGVQLALWKVDDRYVDHGISEGEHYWSRWSAKVRNLIKAAFVKIHLPEDDETESFFASMEVGMDE